MEPLLHLEEGVKVAAQVVARLAEFSAALIIAAAVLEALWRVLKVFWSRDRGGDERPGRGTIQGTSQGADQTKEGLRLSLGLWLAIALEFLLAADVVLTAVAPTWDDIGKLGAVALIRTALNYFLQREVRAEESRRGGAL